MRIAEDVEMKRYKDAITFIMKHILEHHRRPNQHIYDGNTCTDAIICRKYTPSHKFMTDKTYCISLSLTKWLTLNKYVVCNGFVSNCKSFFLKKV